MWLRLRRIGPRRKLGRAKELLNGGKFDEAARIFENLAQEAEGRGMLDRAGDLRLQAARCYIQLNNIERADQEGTRALRLFLRARRPRKVRRLLPKMVAALEKHGKQSRVGARHSQQRYLSIDASTSSEMHVEATGSPRNALPLQLDKSEELDRIIFRCE